MKQHIIWYLFDSGSGSGRKSFDSWNALHSETTSQWKFYSIGLDCLNKQENIGKFVSCDLSRRRDTITALENLISNGQLQYPDVILASPPCENWSIAKCWCWPFDKKTLKKFRTFKQFKQVNKSKQATLGCWKKVAVTYDIGVNCITTTFDIIDYYKPLVWVIENPKTGRIWQYIENNLDRAKQLIRNNTYYNCYDYPLQKAECFGSNIELNLLNKREKAPLVLSTNSIKNCGRNKNEMCSGWDYNKKSEIPEKLLHHIYDEIAKQFPIIVWDLFGGGQNSVWKTLRHDKTFEVYTFDIVKPNRNHPHQFKVDLSQDINTLIEYFSKFPLPDIIVASPLCQSFSQVLRMKGGGTCFWKKNKAGTKLIERSVKEFETLQSGFTKYMKADVQLFIKRLGKKCIDNTIALIKHFKPVHWYIENPKHSLMWFYIEKNLKFYGVSNFATYGLYGYPIRKDTCFLSDIEIKNLFYGKVPNYCAKKDSCGSGMSGFRKLKNKKTTAQIGESGKNSLIPTRLLKKIFQQFN